LALGIDHRSEVGATACPARHRRRQIDTDAQLAASLDCKASWGDVIGVFLQEPD